MPASTGKTTRRTPTRTADRDAAADEQLPALELTAGGSLASAFAVSTLAQTSIATAGLALAQYVALAADRPPPRVHVDRDLAAGWFASSLRPRGWTLPPAWDAIAGDYRAADGWIRLHTNAPHHRVAALAVLGVEADRDMVAAAVARWDSDALERAVVDAGGAAAAMRTPEAWAIHPVGAAVAREPLLAMDPGCEGPLPPHLADIAAPLTGIRVLDLTRVIAGPVATRLLAGWGAEVLRIDPPDSAGRRARRSGRA